MKTIYIMASNTGTYFSKILKVVTHEKYVHVSIALDKKFKKVYSFGRRNPKWMLPAGFVNEDLTKISQIFNNAVCRIYKLDITNKQFYKLKLELKNNYIKNAIKYKYNVRGLPLIKYNKTYQRKYHYVCSQFCAKLLNDAEIIKFEKNYSLITPNDIMNIDGLELIYEGKVIDFLNSL